MRTCHISGNENSTDALSRLLVGPAQDHDASESAECACSIAREAVPAALAPKQVNQTSTKDLKLWFLRQVVTSFHWSRLSGTMKNALSEELWVLVQLLLRGNRIAMPTSP